MSFEQPDPVTMKVLRYTFQAQRQITNEDLRDGNKLSRLSQYDDDIPVEFSDIPVYDRDDDNSTRLVTINGSSPQKSSPRKTYTICLVGFVVIIVASISWSTTSNLQSNQSAGSSSAFCQPPSIKITKQAILELTLFAGLDRLVTEVEGQYLERAVMDGYNEASGGCTDEFERWIYGTKLINQTVEPLYYVDRHENGTLSMTFAEGYTHVLRFQTIISCDGCSDDEAFASVYPESFGDVTELGVRRDRGFVSGKVLAADFVLIEIERELTLAIPKIGRIGEAKISVDESAPVKHMKSYYYDEEMGSAEQDCNEIITEVGEDEVTNHSDSTPDHQDNDEQQCCSSECTVIDGTRYCKDICTPCPREEEEKEEISVPNCCSEVNCVIDRLTNERSCDLNCSMCSPPAEDAYHGSHSGAVSIGGDDDDDDSVVQSFISGKKRSTSARKYASRKESSGAQGRSNPTYLHGGRRIRERSNADRSLSRTSYDHEYDEFGFGLTSGGKKGMDFGGGFRGKKYGVSGEGYGGKKSSYAGIPSGDDDSSTIVVCRTFAPVQSLQTLEPTSKHSISPAPSPTEFPVSISTAFTVTSPPTESLSASPGDGPTATRSAPPSESPTEVCSLEVAITCFDSSDEQISCEDTSPEVSLNCGCAGGMEVDSLSYKYNGPPGATLSCNGRDFTFSSLSPGMDVIFGSATGLPNVMSCTLFNAGEEVVFEIDSSCDGNMDLFLEGTFGQIGGSPILTFVAYACVDNETGEVESHSCLLNVAYTIDICNGGDKAEEIVSIAMTIEDDGSVQEAVNFYDMGDLFPNTCVHVTHLSRIDVCTERVYSVISNVTGSAPSTGLPCIGIATITFSSSDNTMPPTDSPSATPSYLPSTFASITPTEIPTKVPTFPSTPFPTHISATVPPTLASSSFNSSTYQPRNPMSCPVDPCQITAEGTISDDGCDPCVPLIKNADSWCIKYWDKWCVALYARCCSNAACDASTTEGVPLVGTCP